MDWNRKVIILLEYKEAQLPSLLSRKSQKIKNSRVRSRYCSCTGPKFRSQHPCLVAHNCLQLWLQRHLHSYVHVHTHILPTYMFKLNKSPGQSEKQRSCVKTKQPVVPPQYFNIKAKLMGIKWNLTTSYWVLVIVVLFCFLGVKDSSCVYGLGSPDHLFL